MEVKEIWIDVKGYEGLYKVSNLGNVESYCVKVKKKRKSQRKQNNGYLITDLYKDNIQKTITVHRVVAMSFLNNEFNLRCVNHINGIKTDNRVENLEWCTNQYNTNHAISIGTIKTTSVVQKTIDDIFIKEFPSLTEASRHTGVSMPSISRSINGIRKETKGFKFYRI